MQRQRRGRRHAGDGLRGCEAGRQVAARVGRERRHCARQRGIQSGGRRRRAERRHQRGEEPRQAEARAVVAGDGAHKHDALLLLPRGCIQRCAAVRRAS